MSDTIKLVIEITEEDYNMICKQSDASLMRLPMYRALFGIKDGTPLPEEHGRLIDADVVIDGREDDYEFCEAVNATPTIIKADKERSKE